MSTVGSRRVGFLPNVTGNLKIGNRSPRGRGEVAGSKRVRSRFRDAVSRCVALPGLPRTAPSSHGWSRGLRLLRPLKAGSTPLLSLTALRQTAILDKSRQLPPSRVHPTTSSKGFSWQIRVPRSSASVGRRGRLRSIAEIGVGCEPRSRSSNKLLPIKMPMALNNYCAPL